MENCEECNLYRNKDLARKQAKYKITVTDMEDTVVATMSLCEECISILTVENVLE